MLRETQLLKTSNLRSAFRKEHKKVTKSQVSVAGADIHTKIMVLQSTSFCVWPRSTTQFNVKYARRRRRRRQWGKFIIFLLYFTLLLHLIHIVCVEYTPSKLRVKVFDEILLYIQLSCHGTLPSLLKYSTNWLLTSFPVSWWFLLFPLFSVAMLDGLLLKPAVTVPFCRSSVSKHSDGVYVSGCSV